MTAPGEALLFDPVPPSDGGAGGEGSTRPDFIEVRATVFRWADYDTPVWSRPNSKAGRWNRVARDSWAQYWTFSPETAWAEALRAQGIVEADDIEQMRSKFWVGQVCLKEIASLTDPAWLEWLGLSEGDLVGEDWSVCQDAADVLRKAGASGLVTPSAALPGKLSLVIFKRMIRGDWVETAEGPRILRYPDLMLPCRLIGRGRPPLDLRHDVNYRVTLPS